MSPVAATPRCSRRAPRPWRGVLLVLALATAACDDPFRPVDDSVLSDSVKALYRTDAVRLAVRELQRQRVAPAAQDVELPAELVEPLYSALVRVYGQRSSARDDIVNRYRVHTSGNPEVHALLVLVDTSARWTDAWRAGGGGATGNAGVDALVSRYGLTVERYYPLSYADMFTLRSPEPVNTIALAERFQRTGTVRSAEPNSWIGGGAREIEATHVSGGWRLEYSVNWGDCPAGCTAGHSWSFVVSDGGSVTFLGQRGPAPPAGS